MRGLVTAGPWVRSRSWAAGLEVERDLLRGNVIAHRTGADHSETLTRHRGWLTWCAADGWRHALADVRPRWRHPSGAAGRVLADKCCGDARPLRPADAGHGCCRSW